MNRAISLNHTRRQWVDLGILEDLCITRPETCGAIGAAVAFWMRITYSDSTYRGIMSSRGTGQFTRFVIVVGDDLR